MAIDKEAIKEHIRGILVALGDDPNRDRTDVFKDI